MRRILVATATLLALCLPALAHHDPDCSAPYASAQAKKQMKNVRVLVRFAGVRTPMGGRIAGSFGFPWRSLQVVGYSSPGMAQWPGSKKKWHPKTSVVIPLHGHSECLFFNQVYSSRHRWLWMANTAGELLRTIDIDHGRMHLSHSRRLREAFRKVRDRYAFLATTYKAPGFAMPKTKLGPVPKYDPLYDSLLSAQ